MPKKRTNLYLTEHQLERLSYFSNQENLPQAELVRRALDAYLAWLDPAYQPEATQKKRGKV